LSKSLFFLQKSESFFNHHTQLLAMTLDNTPPLNLEFTGFIRKGNETLKELKNTVFHNLKFNVKFTC